VGIELNINTEYDIHFEIGIRRAGFIRPYGCFYSPLTMEIDLTTEITGNRNLKRNLKKAYDYKLRFCEEKNITDYVVNNLVSLQKELSQLKGFSTGFIKSQLRTLLKSKDFRVFFVYDHESNPIATRIIHFNKFYVTDVYASNSKKARISSASYYMMQCLFERLKLEGFKKFDFGRIGPSIHSSDGVYLFKNSFRGRNLQYKGEWSFYKNKIVEFLIFIYKLKYKQPRF